MFARIFNFFKVPSPFNPEAWEGRLSPMTFRRFKMDDLPQCLELYALNEVGRFPKGFNEEYNLCLTEQSSYFLVAERDKQIIASGGISYWMREDTAVLCFGLVRPDCHRKGIGTALLLARIGLLKPAHPRYTVFIFALETSTDFYRRFGFKGYGAWQDAEGCQHPTAYLPIQSSEIVLCRKLLAEHGISVPQDENHIPFRKDAT